MTDLARRDLRDAYPPERPEDLKRLIALREPDPPEDPADRLVHTVGRYRIPTPIPLSDLLLMLALMVFCVAAVRLVELAKLVANLVLS